MTSPNDSRDIVLAFSGGLDTSFCVPYLKERAGTCIPCSPIPAAWTPRNAPSSKQRAAELGVASHVTVDGGPAIWDGFVKPFVWAGEGYQGQYPLLVSDRYLIVDASLARAKELGTNAIAHGCTGMGNDQVRFDLAVKAQRRLPHRGADPRDPEGTHPDPRLRAGLPGARGFGVRSKQKPTPSTRTCWA
jgi:argininosuccinate synthase